MSKKSEVKTIFLDTNVLISTILYPFSTPFKAVLKSVSEPFIPYTSNVCIRELENVFSHRFKDKHYLLDYFFESNIYLNIIVVVTPIDKSELETAIRDVKDRPILRAALARDVDLFLTGDKDFLESGLTHPLPVSPREFLDNY